MKKILVTGAGGSASYNYIQSLRDNPNKEQFYIVGVDTKKYHIELSDLDKKYLVPPVNDPSYIDVINSIIKKENIDFLHAQPDVEVEFLSKNSDKINTKTRLPNFKTVDICQNKMLFNQLLKENNIRVPESYHILNESDLEFALDSIFKNHEKAWIRAIKGAGSKGALPVKELGHAKMWIDYRAKMKGIGYGDFMVSEFLPGDEFAFQSIRENGELIMSQARQRVEYLYGFLSPSGQSSTPSIAKTVHNDQINDLVYKVVKLIDPNATGIFCADLKTDKNGEILLTEINVGRFFTTSYFFSKAGCNMPYYHTKLGLGEAMPYTGTKFNCIPEDWYWVRMVDMGFKLIKNQEWSSDSTYMN